MKFKNRKIINIFGIIAAIGMIFIIGIMTVASSYSVITNDDFDYAMQTGRSVGFWQHILTSWKYVVMVYFNWQGTFFSEFLDSVLNPLLLGGFAEMKVFMTLNCLLVFASLIFLVFVLLEPFGKEYLAEKLVICGCVVFVVAEYNVFPEIFFWYTGAAVLSIPLSMACFAFAAMVLAKRKDSKGWSVASCIVGFLAAGGTLAVSGILCYAALMFVIYWWIRDKKIDRRSVVAFLFFFVSSLINAAAPGNFVRKEVEGGEGLSFFTGIKNTWIFFWGEMDTLVNVYNLLAILLILVACGVLLYRKQRTEDNTWYITGVLSLLTPFICAFPVILGYGVPWVPNRCLFVFYVSLILSIGNAALIVGNVIGRVLDTKKNYAAVLLVAMSMALMLISDFSPRSYRTVRVLKGLYDHVYQDNLRDTKELFAYLEEHKGEDVELDVALTPEEIEYAYCFFLTDYEGDRVNNSVKRVFELNSIRNIREK